MKKIMLGLLVLAFVAPAMAYGPNDVNVGISQVGETNQVTLWYDSAVADANRPRAWGLLITADNSATMKNFVASKVGESTSGSKGYGIFPASITINSSGTVTGWGAPVHSGEGTGSVVVELGSLYSGSGNAPATSGDLLTFTVSGDCNVSVAEWAGDGCVVDEKGRRKHPHPHGGHIHIPGGCGTCPLDQAGGGDLGDQPDGWVGPEDLIAMLNMLGDPTCVANGYYCDVTTLTPAQACMDVAGGGDLGDQPDGWIGPEDLIAMLNMLGQAGCVANGYYCACP